MPVSELPFWDTIFRSFSLTIANAGRFFRIAWFWLLVLTAAVAAFSWYDWPRYQAALTDFSSESWWSGMETFPLSLLAGASVAVAWHRLILLGEATPRSAYWRLDRTVLTYSLWSFLMMTLVALPFILLVVATAWVTPDIPMEALEGAQSDAAPDDPVTSKEQGSITAGQEAATADTENRFSGEHENQIIIATIAILATIAFPLIALCSYIPTRLMLLLPALALGHSHFGAAQSWQRTRGNFWRLFTASMFTAGLPSGLLLLILYPLGYCGLATSQMRYTVDNLIAEFTGLMLGMFFVSLMSLAYQRLGGMDAPAAIGQPAP